jgi:hypothetical protein
MSIRSILTFFWTITICTVALYATPWVRNAAPTGDETIRIGFAPVWSMQYPADAHPDWVTVALALFVAFAVPATLKRADSNNKTRVDFSKPAVQPAVRASHNTHPLTR